MPTDSAIQIETEAVIAAQVIESKGSPARHREISSQGFTESQRKATANKVRATSLETSHAEKRPSPQEAARQRVQATMAEANKKLKLAETESIRVRSELKRAKDELALAKQEHTIQAGKAAEREAGLWNDLAEVRSQTTIALEKASRTRKKWLAISLSAVITVVLWAVMSYTHASGAQVAPRDGSPVGFVPAVSKTLAPSGVENDGTHDFATAADRLDQALGHFRNESPEHVLRRVHKEGAAQGVSVCSFEWNNGQVSLLFGTQPGMELGASMARCADAVEQAAK
jgi:hypothetical protein